MIKRTAVDITGLRSCLFFLLLRLFSTRNVGRMMFVWGINTIYIHIYTQVVFSVMFQSLFACEIYCFSLVGAFILFSFVQCRTGESRRAVIFALWRKLCPVRRSACGSIRGPPNLLTCEHCFPPAIIFLTALDSPVVHVISECFVPSPRSNKCQDVVKLGVKFAITHCEKGTRFQWFTVV